MCIQIDNKCNNIFFAIDDVLLNGIWFENAMGILKLAHKCINGLKQVLLGVCMSLNIIFGSCRNKKNVYTNVYTTEIVLFHLSLKCNTLYTERNRYGVPHTFSIIFFVMEIVYLYKYFFIENVVYTKRGKLHNYMHIWQWIYKSDASIQMIECYNIYYTRKSKDGTMKSSAVMKTAKDAASSRVVKMTKPHRL